MGVAGLERFKGERVATGESHLDKVSEDGEIAINGDEHLDTFVVEQGVGIWLMPMVWFEGVPNLDKSGCEVEQKEIRGRGTPEFAAGELT